MKEHSNAVITCKNCLTTYPVDNKYCYECGQKQSLNSRIKAGDLFLHFFTNLLKIDKGLFVTLYHLAFRPGSMISEYIEGKRTKYLNPLRWLLITSAVIGLIYYTGEIKEISREIYQSIPFPGFSEAFLEKFTFWHYTLQVEQTLLSNLIQINSLTLLSYLFFRRRGYNYLEHLITWIYILPIATIIISLFVYLVSIKGWHLNHMHFLPVVSAYPIYALTTMYKEYPIIGRIIRILSILVLTIALNTLIIAGLAFFFPPG